MDWIAAHDTQMDFIITHGFHDTNWIAHEQVTGEISYNGYKLTDFVPQKTSVYISQNDLHIPEMTVRETLDFSSRCQGIGSRAGMCAYMFSQDQDLMIII